MQLQRTAYSEAHSVQRSGAEADYVRQGEQRSLHRLAISSAEALRRTTSEVSITRIYPLVRPVLKRAAQSAKAHTLSFLTHRLGCDNSQSAVCDFELPFCWSLDGPFTFGSFTYI